VTKLLPEMAKKPAEFLVRAKVQFTKLPALSALSTPTMVPAGALFFTLKLLMLIVINFSAWLNKRREDSRGFPIRDCEIAIMVSANKQLVNQITSPISLTISDLTCFVTSRLTFLRRPGCWRASPDTGPASPEVREKTAVVSREAAF
jgi:hypothetical protein